MTRPLLMGALLVWGACLASAEGFASEPAAPPSPKDQAAPSTPPSPASQIHFETGLTHYGRGEYAQAVEAFQAAFALEPRPAFLFAEAQAERLGGHCPRAMLLYHRFLQTAPPFRQVQAARIGLRRCEEAMALEQATVKDPPSDLGMAEVSRSMDSAPPSPSPSRPWYRDGVGASLGAAGMVGTAVGVALLTSARGFQDRARAAPHYDQYQHQMAKAETRWRWGMVGLAAGLALTGTGAFRLFVWGERDRRGLGWEGRF